jgi:hypothetical protein
MLELLASKKALDEVDGTDGTGQLNKMYEIRLVYLNGMCVLGPVKLG